MELLAPAGSFAAFEAAFTEGADAIYIGAPSCNARALSPDFSYADIGVMNTYLHGHGRKLYVAMNSLIREDEIPRTLEMLSCLAAIGPDALIVQDLGIMGLTRRFFPELAVHASTLLSVHNSEAARFFQRHGCERVVLARELTVAEIAQISQESGMETEVFIHGAMCFSYSGLCLFSSLHGGKSSLRGRCVQPCRRSYQWVHGGGAKKRSAAGGQYLFSMNDLGGVSEIRELQRAGVVSLKIEGRMKSAEYVRQTVRAYRMVLDTLDGPDELTYHAELEARKMLQTGLGRRQSPGYLRHDQPANLISPQQSGTSGLALGQVEYMDRKFENKGQVVLRVTLHQDVQIGDRLRLVDERSGERVSFTLRTMLRGKSPCRRAVKGQRVFVVLDRNMMQPMSAGTQLALFKVDVHARREADRQAARRFFADGKNKRIQVNNQRLKQIQAALGFGGSRKEKEEKASVRRPGWWIRVAAPHECGWRWPVPVEHFVLPLTRENFERLHAATGRKSDWKQSAVWELPPILQQVSLPWYRTAISTLLEQGFQAFQLGNCTQSQLFEGLGEQVSLYGAHTLNILNSAALEEIRQIRFSGVLLSLESDRDNLAALFAAARARNCCPAEGGGSQSSCRLGLYVFGRPPLFTARVQADHFRLGRVFQSPRSEQFVLDHREGLTHARSLVPFSLLRYRGELAAMGVDYLYADFSWGDRKKEAALFSRLLHGKAQEQPVLEGNFNSRLF